MNKLILVVIGTRPEVIKMAPVVSCLRSLKGEFSVHVVGTQQHTDLFFEAAIDLGLEVDSYIKELPKSKNLVEFYSILQNEIGLVIERFQPSLVLVHGDTATATCTSIASFLLGIPVAHVEAGLRSNDLRAPFPEEGNRRIIDGLSNLLFAPTREASENLQVKDGLFVTGNTVIDSLRIAISRNKSKVTNIDERWLHYVKENRKFILVTQHRRESFGHKHQQILNAIWELGSRGYPIVYPVHPNPAIFNRAKEMFHKAPNVHLVSALRYSEFIFLLSNAHLVISDSGGLQEEAPALGVPLLITREKTERENTLKNSLSEIVGSDYHTIVDRAEFWLNQKRNKNQGKWRETIFGDGKSSNFIAKVCKDFLEENALDSVGFDDINN